MNTVAPSWRRFVNQPRPGVVTGIVKADDAVEPRYYLSKNFANVKSLRYAIKSGLRIAVYGADGSLAGTSARFKNGNARNTDILVLTPFGYVRATVKDGLLVSIRYRASRKNAMLGTRRRAQMAVNIGQGTWATSHQVSNGSVFRR